MRERKQIMEDRADAFIVTPGGIGTYEEFFEIYTLKQLGRHKKPIVIFNPLGYYDPLLTLLQHTVEERFMRPASLQLYTVAVTPQQVLEQLTLPGTAADIHETKFVGALTGSGISRQMKIAGPAAPIAGGCGRLFACSA